MKIVMTPKVYWQLQWLCQRTPDEVSAMGILSREDKGLLIDELILVCQEVSAIHVDLDMTWWADHQIQLYEERGIEPWQSSIWVHTHPAGMNTPSGTDEKTMMQRFGSWSFAVMLILTKDSQFYARIDYDHEFPGGMKYRLSQRCDVAVQWNEAPGEPIATETLQQWEKEFQERVTSRNWGLCSLDSLRSGTQAPAKISGKEKQRASVLTPDRCLLNSEKEVMDYEEACEFYGLDPADPCSYEAVYGVWPGPADFDLF